MIVRRVRFLTATLLVAGLGIAPTAHAAHWHGNYYGGGNDHHGDGGNAAAAAIVGGIIGPWRRCREAPVLLDSPRDLIQRHRL
jgi:hypothetical protein